MVFTFVQHSLRHNSRLLKVLRGGELSAGDRRGYERPEISCMAKTISRSLDGNKPTETRYEN
jgi:hypothetical protein